MMMVMFCMCAACDIAFARENARTPMPGGWHSENANSEFISQLYDNAASIAAVRPGVVHESYAQVNHLPLPYLGLLTTDI